MHYVYHPYYKICLYLVIKIWPYLVFFFFFITLHSIFITDHSSLVTQFSPLITRHSIFATHHSSLKIPHIPLPHPFGHCFHFLSLKYFNLFVGPIPNHQVRPSISLVKHPIKPLYEPVKMVASSSSSLSFIF